VLDKSWIKTLYAPKLVNPIFIQALALSDPVSTAVTRLLLQYANPHKFAELYSPHFPDYIIAGEDGLCTLPRCEFSANNHLTPNIVLLTGNMQQLPEGSAANYEVFTTIVTYVKALGCTHVLSYGGFPTEHPDNSIYVAATSETLAAHVVNACGGKIFSHGELAGAMGLILGLAQTQDLSGLCVLKPLISRVPPEVTALAIFNYLLSIMESKRN
jgi:proteasome assembly chaperone (PAC2) family protein